MCISKRHLDSLRKIIQKKPIIMGVGNVLRGDDAVGPTLVDQLEGHIEATCINAGPAPENYLAPIIKASPETILIIDAAHLGTETGRCKLLNNEQIASLRFSSHALSTPNWLQYLQKRTPATLYMLAIQPATLEFGAPMSPQIIKTLNRLHALLASQKMPSA